MARYASSYLNKGEYVYTPGMRFYLDWDKITTEYQDNCHLVAITEQHIHLLLLLLDLASFYNIWGYGSQKAWTETEFLEWDTIEAFTNNLRLCLMSGCAVSDIVTALDGIRDAITNQTPALDTGISQNDALDAIAAAQGVSSAWTLAKGGLTILFPEAAIPISIGLDVIRGLVDNANSSESEVFEIAKMLGSTSGVLPD